MTVQVYIKGTGGGGEATEEILKNCFEDSDCNDGECPYYIDGGCLYAERKHTQKDDV